MSEEMIEVVTPVCAFCGKPGKVTMPKAAWEAFNNGAFVQRAWPEGSAEDREMLINGTHGPCFKRAFKDWD